MNEESLTYRRALRVTVIVIAALAVIAIPVGLFVAGGAGLVAAEIGVLVAALAGLTTQIAMVMAHQKAPHVLAAYVGGSWLAKMLVIVIALVILDGIDGFHKALFAGFMLTGVVATLVVDMWAIKSSRVPYVDEGSK